RGEGSGGTSPVPVRRPWTRRSPDRDRSSAPRAGPSGSGRQRPAASLRQARRGGPADVHGRAGPHRAGRLRPAESEALVTTATPGVSEYDRFGPWIDEVATPADVPRLFRDHPVDLDGARLV